MCDLNHDRFEIRKMADGCSIEYFTEGTRIKCKAYLRGKIEGQVMAYDPISKFLILKCGHKDEHSNVQDFEFVNLSYVTELHCDNSNNNYISEFPRPVNILKIKEKVRKTLEQRQIELSLPYEGRRLFEEITKIFFHKKGDVQIKNMDIIVMDELAISPPYHIESIRRLKQNVTSYDYVKKIIENAKQK